MSVMIDGKVLESTIDMWGESFFHVREYFTKKERKAVCEKKPTACGRGEMLLTRHRLVKYKVSLLIVH